ncbi:MAG: HupU protein [Candidatus Thiothrix moscowensis]|nr:HupU protein [Candidatus Thiothrix moscowensis]
MNVLWLQSGGCGGCTMSLLCAENPGLLDTFANAGIELLWHPSLSEASGATVITLLEQLADGTQTLDVLCVEGSILRGPNGTGAFHKLAGTDTAMLHWVQRLAEQAAYTLAIGSCAAFGGMTAGGCNPTDACGLQYDGHLPGGALGKDYHSRAGLPVINVAGCPTHPGWITETLLLLALQGMQPDELDSFARPRFYSDHLAHHGCSRNEYYEYKASAEKPSDLGCMMEHMGCLGTQAHADCNLRLWNGQGSCTRAGYACINCTAPEFEEPGHPFLHTPNIAGIPIGLPTDMPKAWFVALASLSKAATPKRVRENAQADHIVVQPGKKK